MPRPITLTAALLIGLSTTATAITAPDFAQPTQHSSEQTTQKHTSETLAQINAAVELTKEDPTAFCFVVTLPETYQEARAIRNQWIAAQAQFDQTDHPVFFTQADDAQFVLDNAFITSPQAVIVFRNGRPFHTRTGAMTDKNIQAFLALAFDDSAPTTNAPDQTRYLYDSMNELIDQGQQAAAAQGACSIMLNLHALIHGPYSTTYSASDLNEMTELYNESQLALTSLDLNNDSVLDQVNTARAMGIKTWNKRTRSTFGIGIWFDLAFVTGDTDSVLDWIDQGIVNPAQSKRVAKSLADYGQPLAQLLISTHRYEALAMTYSSPAQITSAFEDANPDQLESVTHTAAAYHAALLLAGHNAQAWQVAQITEDFAGPQLASVALCTAAINAGALNDRHAFLIENIDRDQHATLIEMMNTSFAVVPTDE